MLLVTEQAVGRVPLEIVPHLLDGIEFGSILGEEFGVESRVIQQQLADDRSFVNLALVPEKNDRTAQVLEEVPKERRHVHGFEVVLLKTGIETDVLAHRTDGEHGQGGDAVMLVVVADDRRDALRAPGAPACRNEQEAAFIKER